LEAGIWLAKLTLQLTLLQPVVPPALVEGVVIVDVIPLVSFMNDGYKSDLYSCLLCFLLLLFSVLVIMVRFTVEILGHQIFRHLTGTPSLRSLFSTIYLILRSE